MLMKIEYRKSDKFVTRRIYLPEFFGSISASETMGVIEGDYDIDINKNYTYNETLNTLTEVDPSTLLIVVVPKVVTMRQARLALLQSNLLATVDTAIATGADEAMKIEWEYATEVHRDWGSLIAMTEALGMTAVQLDDLFLLASTL